MERDERHVDGQVYRVGQSEEQVGGGYQHQDLPYLDFLRQLLDVVGTFDASGGAGLGVRHNSRYGE